MLDIKLLRDSPGIVKKSLEKRRDSEKLGWLAEVLGLDKDYRGKLQKAEALRKERNDLDSDVKKLVSQKKDFSSQVKKSKKLGEEIKGLENSSAPLKEKIDWFLMRLPNVLHDSVPFGRDDSENVVVKEFGKKLSRKEMPSHGEILEKSNWADFERATKISGAGFYFLKGKFALLEMALSRFALDSLAKKGFTVIVPPFMLNRSAYEGVTDLADFENVMYKIDSEDLYLIATSEHPICAMYKDEIFSEQDLPLKLAGFSPCFRREIGKHGIDSRGIFRVHQFNKVEQFVFCPPEDSWKFHEEITRNAEELFEALGLAFRRVNICTGDIGIVAAKKFDLEAWMPREEKFREVVSSSNCTSYQAVRSNIKFRKKSGDKEFVHTLNSTAIAMPRALRAMVETYYDNGVLKIPKVLQPYMNGEKEIAAEK